MSQCMVPVGQSAFFLHGMWPTTVTLIERGARAAKSAQPLSPTAQRGRAVFERIGCAKCHTPELQTGSYNLALRGGGSVAVPQLSNQQVALYSDLLLHDMGPGLDEGVVMRQARGPEFRTAPLWGVSVRERFLHDGRADSVDQAIRLHGGEATIIRDRYAALRHDERGALLRFLKAL